MKLIGTAKRQRTEERAYRVFISYRHSDPATVGSDGEFAISFSGIQRVGEVIGGGDKGSASPQRIP